MKKLVMFGIIVTLLLSIFPFVYAEDEEIMLLDFELEKYISQWKLTDLVPVDEESVNLLFFCNSEIYGFHL